MNANETQVGGQHYKTEIQPEWMPIPGWEGYYEASSAGKIRSIPRVVARTHPKNTNILQKRIYGGTVLKPKIGRSGYQEVNLWRDNIGKMISVHRLVCAAFTGQMCDGMDVNHINGIRTDNRATNLEWMSRRDNLFYSEQILGRKMVWTHQKERTLQRMGLL